MNLLLTVKPKIQTQTVKLMFKKKLQIKIVTQTFTLKQKLQIDNKKIYYRFAVALPTADVGHILVYVTHEEAITEKRWVNM